MECTPMQYDTACRRKRPFSKYIAIGPYLRKYVRFIASSLVRSTNLLSGPGTDAQITGAGYAKNPADGHSFRTAGN